MNRQLLVIAAISMVLVSVQVQAAKVKDVKVVNEAGEAVPVVVEGSVSAELSEPVSVTVQEPLAVDVDAVREPFQFDGFIERDTSSDPPQVTLFSLPSDRALVIETVSVAGFNAELLAQVFLVERFGNALATIPMTQIGAGNNYSALHRVVLRVNPGATIDGIVNGTGRFRFMLSGYLLPTSE
ncbi:MAG: hypothetical protein ABJ308_09145 [Halieaceae bacterium]